MKPRTRNPEPRTPSSLWLRLASTAAAALVLFLAAPASAPARAQEARGAVTIEALAPGELRDWDRRIDAMQRAGELRFREARPDTLIRGRVHQRADQYYRGVRVFGADVARQSVQGTTESAFGTVYAGIDLDSSPGLDESAALAVFAATAGTAPAGRPELVVLPQDGGRYALAWRMRIVRRNDARQYFIDAQTGAPLLDYSDRRTQSAVGRARGVLGDTKKISVHRAVGSFTTSDELRPPAIETYDLQGNPRRADDFLLGRVTFGTPDLGSDTDNDWTDGPIDDAHVYAGYTYDYYFKRFGRHGLDNADIRLRSLVHPVRRDDFDRYIDDYPDFFLNAFYDGRGVMVYGEGLPAGYTYAGQTWDYLSGGLDIVAHELTHGVTEYTSNLIYRGESGALDEAFSDIMGTSVEFFFQPAGSGPLKADYLMGEDVIRPGGLRSLANPGAFGDPDHYSRRYLGQEDNGGVHINSTIVSHAFYLAIEGGTNRTSGLAVQGVGAANRGQVEKVFYRAFTEMLPGNASFAVGRAATIQAARDLYGAGGAVEHAVADAWTAVGVN